MWKLESGRGATSQETPHPTSHPQQSLGRSGGGQALAVLSGHEIDIISCNPLRYEPNYAPRVEEEVPRHLDRDPASPSDGVDRGRIAEPDLARGEDHLVDGPA